MAAYPKTIGGCVDQLYKMREQRLVIQKKVDEMKSAESALHDHIINSFKKDEIEGARGKAASASISHTTVAQVDDWEKFYKYIAAEGAFDLLQRRVNDGAYRARLEDEIVVPGVTAFSFPKLSVTKVAK